MEQQKTEEEIKQELKEMEDQPEEPVNAPVDEAGPEVEEVEEVVESVEVEHTEELPKKLVDEPKMVASGPSRMDRLKFFFNECKRVLRVTKKPNKQEFTTIVKISAIGMGVIGFLGFIIFFLKEMLF